MNEPHNPHAPHNEESLRTLDTETVNPIARKSGRWVYVVGVLAFFVYAAWMMGPYLRSVIVRDAAVTTRAYVSTSPIDGEVEFKSFGFNRVVGADGVILLVRNPRLSREHLDEAEIAVDLAKSRVEEFEQFLNEIKQLDTERAALKSQYADSFRAELDTRIANLDRQLSVIRERIDVMAKIAKRSMELARRGTGPETSADEAKLRVSDLELQTATLQADLDYARVRRAAADHGIFITADGEDPVWVRGARLELKLEKKQARLELRRAQAELEREMAHLQAAEADFHRRSEATVNAPPGSIVWSERVAPGALVRAGTPVVEWLDCSKVMVDVPVSDAEASLIRPGMDAKVVLEGESVTRKARVLLTRGSASTLGREDLAAIAKGRHDSEAQVLLELKFDSGGTAECPVGRAAYVDFPDVGLIDVIRARLRL